MIKPYTAVGLIPTVRGIRKRKDIKINLEHLHHLVKAASWLSSLDLPVRLIAFPEGALQGFNDEVLDADHATFARLALVETQARGTETAGTVVGVCDGADWCQRFLDLHRPDAVRVLDFPHAVEYLAAAARASFGAEAPAAAAWLTAQAHELKHGDPVLVLGALEGLPVATAPDPPTVAMPPR